MTDDDEREVWLRALGTGDAVSRNAVSRNALESIRAREAGERRKVAEAIAAAMAEERAAVVAWLRRGAGLSGGEPAEEWSDLWVAARDIERGEHRREEER